VIRPGLKVDQRNEKEIKCPKVGYIGRFYQRLITKGADFISEITVSNN
jgi:hypothetical protein